MRRLDIERYLLALLSTKGVGPATIKKNLTSIQASISSADVFDALAPVMGAAANRASWAAALAKADRTLERCDALGITILSPLSSAYPRRLMDLGTPPPILFCRGNLSLLTRPALGVIGTRKSTAFGEIVARRIGSFFSGKGIPICNGLADGIDICSVTSEEAFSPCAIGVIAAGLDLREVKLSSQRTTERAVQALEAGGLLVSELPPGTEEDQNSVISSCRLQAGMSQILLLVQSSINGGSRYTVKQFCSLPRTLAYIVPSESHIADMTFGANLMLSRGEGGLADFVGLKSGKSIKARLMRICSRDDYEIILRELAEGATPLV